MTDESADWLEPSDALDIVLAHCEPLDAAELPLAQALHRALAVDVRSRVDHPPWDNSAMDGFAVRAEDVAGAAPDRPVVLPISADVPAGAFPHGPLDAGSAVRIMTGAPVPAGASGVVRIEHTDGGAGDQVAVFDDSDARRNIRLRGENLRVDDPVAGTGDEVTPSVTGLLAVAGVDRVAVHRAPRIAVIANGDELADLGRREEIESGRKIANSNSYALAAQLSEAHAVPVDLGIASDDPGDLRRRLETAEGCDGIITSGGVSVGDHDHVKRVLRELGLRKLFWRTRMKPGSATLFGVLDGRPVWGVPGNPVSAMVTFEVLIRPAVRRMAGHRRIARRPVIARAGVGMRSKAGITEYLRISLREGEDGPEAIPTGPQGSGILTSMASADGLLPVPRGIEEIHEGETVTVIPLHD